MWATFVLCAHTACVTTAADTIRRCTQVSNLTPDDTWNSITRKLRGAYRASLTIGETCPYCDTLLTPVDTGTDIDGSRVWVTECCSARLEYIERPQV
jgi:hypothetical protein